jgi:hypothetical protein
MKINWELFDEKLKNIDFPLLLILKFFNSMHLVDDGNASIILRYIIKNNINTFLIYPFYLLIPKLQKNKYELTIDILFTFYDLIKKRNKRITLIKKWYNIYKKKFFWKKEIESQINDLNNLKLLIQAIFDTSKGGTHFSLKMASLMKSNVNNSREFTINSAIERLRQVFSLLGASFFKESEIPIITIDNFENMEDELKIKYLNLVYHKTIQNLSLIINIFEEYNMINLQLDNLINPCFITIEEDFNQDSDIEDLTDMF